MVFNVPVHKSSGAHTSPKTVPEAADAEKIPRKYCSSDKYAYICTLKRFKYLFYESNVRYSRDCRSAI